MIAANASDSDSDNRTVILKAKKKYYTMPVVFEDIHNVNLLIYGKWYASKSIKYWTKSGKSFHDYINFQSCSGIEISGSGKIDGRGYHWWMTSWLVNTKYFKKGDRRPHMIIMNDCDNMTFHDLILKNSPSFHLKTSNTNNTVISNLSRAISRFHPCQILILVYLNHF